MQLAFHSAVLRGVLAGIGARLPLNQSFALEAQCDYDHPLVATGTERLSKDRAAPRSWLHSSVLGEAAGGCHGQLRIIANS